MLAFGIWHGQPGQANNRSWIAELPPLPSLTEKVSFSGDMIWVQLQDTIRLGKLAELLDLNSEELSSLNEKSRDSSLPVRVLDQAALGVCRSAFIDFSC